MVYGQTPQYLSNLVPPQDQYIHNHSTRQRSQMQNGSLPQLIWHCPINHTSLEQIPDIIKQNPSISNLKRHLRADNTNRKTP
jgi:hypothetical protein